MALPKWQRSGGREFAFYHSHSGFEWENLDTTNKYQEMLCNDFQVGFCVHVPRKFAGLQMLYLILRYPTSLCMFNFSQSKSCSIE